MSTSKKQPIKSDESEDMELEASAMVEEKKVEEVVVEKTDEDATEPAERKKTVSLKREKKQPLSDEKIDESGLEPEAVAVKGEKKSKEKKESKKHKATKSSSSTEKAKRKHKSMRAKKLVMGKRFTDSCQRMNTHACKNGDKYHFPHSRVRNLIRDVIANSDHPNAHEIQLPKSTSVHIHQIAERELRDIIRKISLILYRRGRRTVMESEIDQLREVLNSDSPFYKRPYVESVEKKVKKVVTKVK